MVEMRSSGEERVSSEEGGLRREKKRRNNVSADCSGHGFGHLLQSSEQSQTENPVAMEQIVIAGKSINEIERCKMRVL